MLSEKEIDSYHSQGYIVPDFQLPAADLDGIRHSHQKLVAHYPEFEDYCPALLAFDPYFLGIARNPDILDMVAQILGSDIALWNSSFFAKPAGKGKRVPWHQDGEYWPIRPLATCSVWIAVDESNRDNGCLQVIPGSHRDRSLNQHEHNDSKNVSLPLQLKEGEFDAAKAVPIELKPGQISLHDVYIIHGSEPNQSSRPRGGMTLRYMPTTSVYDREIARAGEGPLSMKERTLYLMRGVDRSGLNDFNVRR